MCKRDRGVRQISKLQTRNQPGIMFFFFLLFCRGRNFASSLAVRCPLGGEAPLTCVTLSAHLSPGWDRVPCGAETMALGRGRRRSLSALPPRSDTVDKEKPAKKVSSSSPPPFLDFLPPVVSVLGCLCWKYARAKVSRLSSLPLHAEETNYLNRWTSLF